MIQTALDYFARQPLGDFYSFHHAASFGHQTRDVGAGGNVATFIQRFEVQPNGRFIYHGELLPVFKGSLVPGTHGGFSPCEEVRL